MCKLLKQNPESREGVVIATSAVGIFTNCILALVKIIIGAAVSSIAIISEGINNASDSANSIITIVGTKLSTKHPTKKHPFGYGRIEYLTSLVISVLILVTGIELLINSVKLIFEPTELSVSYITLAIIALSAVVKLWLGAFNIKQGKKIDSTTLIAIGKDSYGDCIVSVVTIISALVYLWFGYSIDAYAGVFTSLFVLKAGFEVLRDTVSDLLGQSGDKELADELYKMVLEEPIVLNAADMMLHNYGPDAYSGSVNVEIDHEKTIGEAYAAIHALQLKIMHEHNIIMIFGMYAVDHDHEEIKQMRVEIASFVKSQEHVQSYHALYIDPDNKDIYCDLVVDYELQDWTKLRKDFTEYMNKLYPESRLELVIETPYV